MTYIYKARVHILFFCCFFIARRTIKPKHTPYSNKSYTNLEAIEQDLCLVFQIDERI